MEQGWIKLHRKLLENPLMKKPTWAWLWVVLLLKANHKENKMIWNNNVIIIKEGQFITGRKELSKDSGIPESTIENILNYLENQQQIQQQKESKYRLITIVNWKLHQSSDTQSDNKPTTKQQQADTNKNDNKDKNEKKDTETSSGDINVLIKMFEKLNPASKKFYGITTQRKACASLIETYGFERVCMVVQKTLPKTNGLQFFPVITTPLQLNDKWVALESAIRKYQSENKLKGRGFA